MLSSQNQKIHFVGVGGSGMSGIAEILRNLGFNISGSDTKQTDSTNRLQGLGVNIAYSHESQNVHGKDLIVVSSAIKHSNPEILEAKILNIPIVHRTEMLVELMKSKENIVVAGTHGKTTTTSILSHVLHSLGLDPTVVVGGHVHSFSSHAKLGQSKFFIAEADESDGSFLKFQPTVAVITNIDRDHLEHYGSLENIFFAFQNFVQSIPSTGTVCVCTDNVLASNLIPSITAKVITYGLNDEAYVTAKNIRANGFATTFSPVIGGNIYPDVTLPLPGRYNVSNTLASFAVAHALEIKLETIAQALLSFAGTLHRYTLLGAVNKHLIVDDYAHNPKKIETVLTGTKESFPNKRIIAIFQPHRYTRVKEQGDEFAKCFYHADKVIITPVYSAGELPLADATVEILGEKITIQSFQGMPNRVEIAKNFHHAVELCCRYQFEETLFLTLGAGDVAQVGHMLKERLTIEN